MLERPFDVIKGLLQVSFTSFITHYVPVMANYSTAPAALACNASALSWPGLFGAEILNLSSELVRNFSRDVSSQLYYTHPSSAVTNVDFCNITITYTHPGQVTTILSMSRLGCLRPLGTDDSRLSEVAAGWLVALHCQTSQWLAL
jgi:hypothetical protein